MPALILLLMLFLPGPAKAATAPVIINEIGAFAPSGQEWVEIYNRGAEPVDLTDWKFFENKTNHELKLWCGGAACAQKPILLPGSYALIVQDANKFLAAFPGQSALIMDSSWSSLNEKGEEVGLKNERGEWQERFTYLPSPDTSLERRRTDRDDYSADNWRPHPTGSSAGKENFWACGADCAAAPPPPAASSSPRTDSSATLLTTSNAATAEKFVSTTVALNEIFSGKDSADDGFIELFNRGPAPMNLSGWQIMAGKTKFALAGALEPNQYWALGRALTGLVISGNATTTVSLVTATSEIADRVGVPKTGRGNSFARDAGDAWQVTTAATRGEKNYIVEPNSAPVAWELTLPENAAPGEPTFLSAAGSADPRGGRLGFHWQFGDGEEADGETVTHNFKSAGNFSILITATSSAGTRDATQRTIAISASARAPTDVVLNEILPNPEGQDSAEFIEIFNRGDQTAELSGFQLTEGNSRYALPTGTQIQARDWLVFYRRVSKLTLTNGAGTIRLLSPRGSVLDSVSYQNSPSGESFSRAGEDWRWSARPTPGAPNEKISTTTPPRIGSLNVAKARKTRRMGSSIRIDVGLDLTAARQLPSRRSIAVEGTVASLPGDFGSQYIYIVDKGGGLPIFSAKKKFPTLALGDRVRVRGAMGSSREQSRLLISAATDITLIADGEPPESVSSTVAAALTRPPGTLVTLAGQATQINGNRIYLDDGSAEIVVTLKKSTQRLRGLFVVGEQLRVTGILEKNGGALELWPRREGEIVRADASPSAKNSAAATHSAAYPLITFGGGVALFIFNFLKRKNLF